MMPETRDLLAKAGTALGNARAILAIEVAEIAAREAYMTAFHAAQALLFERNGAVPKTHSGVHGAFGRIAKAEPAIGRDLSRFLADAFSKKQIADYATNRTIDLAEAGEAIEQAAKFLATIEAVLAKGEQQESLAGATRDQSG